MPLFANSLLLGWIWYTYNSSPVMICLRDTSASLHMSNDMACSTYTLCWISTPHGLNQQLLTTPQWG